MTVTNSTFDRNSARGFGGAIDSFGGDGTTHPTTNLNSVTMTRNLADVDAMDGGGGGGIQNGGVAYTVKNSLLVDNTTVEIGNSNCSGATYVSLGGNVSNDLDGCAGFAAIGDVGDGSSLLIGSLSGNGGLTGTVPLLAGNLAIDHTFSCPPTDQRGVTRPQGAACDSGAFELVPPAPVTTAATSGAIAPAAKCKKKKKKRHAVAAKKKKCKRRKK
jgi:hypothetical protein